MIITLWGTRGSLACSGPDTERYGGNTSCIEVLGSDDTTLIFDAGTGIRRLGLKLDKKIKRVNILLTHLHLDHIQGLGFFMPLFDSNAEIHIYGPAQTANQLHSLLSKYLSPPLFPVLLNDLPCQLYLHAVPKTGFDIGEFHIKGEYVCHPGLTLGYRISSPTGSIAYLPDHEPALGTMTFPFDSNWTSGYDLAKEVDLLIHDSQYFKEEYESHLGWGHSTIDQALKFAVLANVKAFVTFHHDPAHNDDQLDNLLTRAISAEKFNFKIVAGKEGTVIKLP
jgi:phosphoribosyl 1,2-cyclic phosphodiesterase